MIEDMIRVVSICVEDGGGVAARKKLHVKLEVY